MAKPPYDDVKLSGEVEGRFLYWVPLSKHVLPFVMVDPPTAVLPILLSADGYCPAEADRLRQLGFRLMAHWMDAVEAKWIERRGKIRASPAEYVDYHGKLSSQPPADQFAVLYNASGANVAACVVNMATAGLRLVVDHTLYWSSCPTIDEADYLCAVLNSDRVDSAIKPFQALGLAGERHIHKKVLELPIPIFDPHDEVQKRIAELGFDARRRASQLAKGVRLPNGLAGRRKTGSDDGVRLTGDH